ncbi:hypothetical protein ACFL2C_01215 [Patescibacteria group bacterium]
MQLDTTATAAEFVKLSSFVGFLACTALLVNMNRKVHGKVFKKGSRTYWLMFFVSSIIPLLLILYLFTVLFDSKLPQLYRTKPNVEYYKK